MTASLFPDSRRTGGLTARAAGKSFEQLILASQRDGDGQVCQLVQIKNFAKYIPNDDKRPGAPRVKLIQEKSPFDFCGSVCGSAVGIFIDAKSLDDKPSFPICDPKIVKPHQINVLARLESTGAIAGFLVRCGRMNDYRWLFASAAVNALVVRKPLDWDAPAWDVLGEIRWGYGVPLRKLVEIGSVKA